MHQCFHIALLFYVSTLKIVHYNRSNLHVIHLTTHNDHAYWSINYS